MSYAERREAILEVLCIRRHDTYRNLASTTNLSGLSNKAKTASPMDAEKNNLALRPFDFSSSLESRS
ncbi:hypothetical protein D5282_21820 [bacterium 1xD8-48]|nr:hypothetical protein [bacterium 1xD8-48]